MAKPGPKPGSIHTQEVRNRIRAAMLVNRLSDFVEGKIEPRTGKPVELSTAQVSAALGLLRKIVPDLAQVEHSGEIKHAFAIEVPAPAATVESWTQTQVPRLQ
jgi:hypothetical protein